MLLGCCMNCDQHDLWVSNGKVFCTHPDNDHDFKWGMFVGYDSHVQESAYNPPPAKCPLRRIDAKA